MNKINNSLEKIQSGEGSKFDSGVASLERMHTSMVQANISSSIYSIQGLRSWFSALRSLERELYAYLSDDDKKLLKEKRVSSIPNNSNLIPILFNKLDSYDKTLRYLHTAKGFGLNNNSGDLGSALEEDMY